MKLIEILGQAIQKSGRVLWSHFIFPNTQKVGIFCIIPQLSIPCKKKNEWQWHQNGSHSCSPCCMSDSAWHDASSLPKLGVTNSVKLRNRSQARAVAPYHCNITGQKCLPRRSKINVGSGFAMDMFKKCHIHQVHPRLPHIGSNARSTIGQQGLEECHWPWAWSTQGHVHWHKGWPLSLLEEKTKNILRTFRIIHRHLWKWCR